MPLAGSGLPGIGERLDQQAHQPGLSGPDVAERAGHHDGDGGPDARLRAGPPAHEVPLKAEVLVNPAADSLKGSAVAARADLAPGCRRAAVLEVVAVRLERTPGKLCAARSRSRADAAHLVLLRVHDAVRPPGIEGARGIRHHRRVGQRIRDQLEPFEVRQLIDSVPREL